MPQQPTQVPAGPRGKSVGCERYAAHVLNNRDWASIIWFVLLALFVVRHREVRSSAARALHSLLSPKVLFSIVALFIYSCRLVLLGLQLGWWDWVLTKDAIVWFIGTAFVLLLNVPRSAQRGFFRKTMTDAVRVTVLLEFFLNLFVLSLPVELLLVPVIFLVIAIPIVAKGDERYASVVRFTNGLASTIGLLIGGYVVWRLIVDWGEVANIETVQSLALPVWLTIGLLPFIYIISLWTNYGSAFARIDIATDDRRARLRSKAALMTTLHLRTAEAGSFVWPWVRRLVDSRSFGEAREVIKDYRGRSRNGTGGMSPTAAPS